MTVQVSAIQALDDLLERSDSFIAKMHELGAQPEGIRTLQRLFSPSEAAKMVRRDRTTLARAEAELDMAAPPRDPKSGRRIGYTLEQIQAFRKHFGTLPWRDPLEHAIKLVIQNLKGGTGKSTTTVNLAHSLGLKGYRVLVIDTDSQATTTSFFGYVPDRDLTRDDTLFPYLSGDQATLEYAVRRTHWPTIDLIPACLGLSDVEIGGILEIADAAPESRADFFMELRRGIDQIASNYDVVLIDTPPALGVLALMDLLAADALIIPTTAKMADFASTIQFLRMGREYISQIAPSKQYLWRQVLITQFSRRGKHSKDEKTLQEQFVEAMQGVFGDAKFRHVMHEAVEVQSAAATFTSPYEQVQPNRRVIMQMENVFDEIELAIQRCWPSKLEELQERGLV